MAADSGAESPSALALRRGVSGVLFAKWLIHMAFRAVRDVTESAFRALRSGTDRVVSSKLLLAGVGLGPDPLAGLRAVRDGDQLVGAGGGQVVALSN